MTQKFPGKLSENPKIIDLPKRESFNRKLWKFQEENQLKQKFPVRNFRKFGYASCGCPFFPGISEKLFCSPLEISGYPNRIVLTWKGERGTQL